MRSSLPVKVNKVYSTSTSTACAYNIIVGSTELQPSVFKETSERI